MSVNKVMLIGNIGTIEARDFNGSKIVNLSLATTEKGYTAKDGTVVEDRTTWHRVTMFGKPAEIVSKYADKGTKVYVEGKLSNRQYEDSQGQKRSVTEVVVDGMNGKLELLSSVKQQQAPQASQAPQVQQAQQVQQVLNLDNDLPF